MQAEVFDQLGHLASRDIRQLARAQFPQQDGWLAWGAESLIVECGGIVVQLSEIAAAQCFPLALWKVRRISVPTRCPPAARVYRRYAR